MHYSSKSVCLETVISFLLRVCEAFVCSYSELRSEAARKCSDHAENLFQDSEQRQICLVMKHSQVLCLLDPTFPSLLVLPSVPSAR